MSDDPSQRENQDRPRVVLQKEHEARYCTQKLGVSKERLTEAVTEVGNSGPKVEEFFSKRVPVPRRRRGRVFGVAAPGAMIRWVSHNALGR